MRVEPTQDVRDLLQKVVSSIAVSPELVMVSHTVQNKEATLTVSISEDDFARLSENGARTFRALDTVVAAMAKRDRVDMRLEVVSASTSARTLAKNLAQPALPKSPIQDKRTMNERWQSN